MIALTAFTPVPFRFVLGSIDSVDSVFSPVFERTLSDSIEKNRGVWRQT